MRTAQVTEFGAPEVLVAGEAPDPVAGPGEVVVRVSVADVLFLDAQLRGGWGRDYFDVTPPYVPGTGVAGRVISVGPEVDPAWTDRSVVTRTDGGGYAERAVVAADGLVPVPDGLGLREAAALGQAGPAALSLIDAARLTRGAWVLITAAGGGLGTLLVQLAHAAGARVIAAARGGHKLDLARELGAEVVVDYTDPAWTERLREATGGTGPEVVFDGVGGRIGAVAFAATAPGGRFFAHGVPSGTFAETDPDEAERRAITVTGIEQVQFGPADFRRLASRVLDEAVAGRVRPVIDRTLPLDRADEAHAAIEARDVTGKILLLV